MTAEFSLAVHGLVYLLHKQCVVSSERLAENICTNPARVRKVMAKIKHAGLVCSAEGKGHGYQAVAQSENITLLQVLDALEEDVVGVAWRSGDVDMNCLVASGMADVMDHIYGEMNQLCKEHLMKVTIGSIHDTIFSDDRKKE